MPLSSYRVLSRDQVYIAPPVSVKFTPKKIAPEHIKSMQFEPPTVGSYGHADTTQIFTNDGVVTRTANNRFETTYKDFKRNGYFSQVDDGGFGRWIKAATERYPESFNYVRLPKETANSGVIVSFGDRRAEFPIGDTPLPKYVSDLVAVEVHHNRIGSAISRIYANSKEALTRYLRTHDGEGLASYLTSLGLSPKDISYIGEGFLPGNAIYGVDRTEDGKIILTAARDAYSKIVRDAKLLGVNPEDLLNSILAEEITHIWRGDVDKDGNPIKIEMEAKDIVAKHYERLAQGADGDPKKAELRRKYKKLAAIKEFDRDTTLQRYGKKSVYGKLYSKNRAALEEILESEAVDRGYTGKNIAKYVVNKLREIGEEAEANDGKPEAKSRLEKIADKEVPKEAETEETPAEAN